MIRKNYLYTKSKLKSFNLVIRKLNNWIGNIIIGMCMYQLIFLLCCYVMKNENKKKEVILFYVHIFFFFLNYFHIHLTIQNQC